MLMREYGHTRQEEQILMADDCLIFFGGIFRGRHLTDGGHGGRLGRLHAHHPQLAGHHVNRHGPPCFLDYLAYKQSRPHHLSGGLFHHLFWWNLGSFAPPQDISDIWKPWWRCSWSSYDTFRWGLHSWAQNGQWAPLGGSHRYQASYTSGHSECSSYLGSSVSTSTMLLGGRLWILLFLMVLSSSSWMG